MAQISYGTITITDTNDIERIYVVYAKHTSNTNSSGLPAAANWKESIAEAPGSGNYIWQRTVVKKSGITTLIYGDPVCVTGPQGIQGIQGIQGPEGEAATNITDIQVQYGVSANWNTQPSSWSNNSPDYDSTKPNYWTRTRLVYEDGTYSDWIVSQDHASTEAIAQAVSANSIAQDANENAQDALSQATEAQQLVTHIDNLLGGHFLWHGNALSQATPSGARVVERIKDGSTDVSNTPSKWLHNVNIGANGISLRYNEAIMAQLAANQSSSANTALKFYQPPTVNGNTTTQGNLAMELSGSALKFYDSTGTIAQATFGGNKAVISGTINVIDGQIGNSPDSYWYIGNYLDYQQNNSAAIKSYGTAFIQLGNSLTWRVATNRIHSAWNNDNSSGDAFRLHFPSYYNKNNEEKYWDVGLHLPQSINDKFLYVRNAAKTETLENLNNDLEDSGYNYWEYQFWVDGAGNVHAPGFFIGNSTTPIGGGAGTVAERLTQGYGSATQPIYFNSSGVPTNTTYTLNAAGAKGVDTSISAASTSTNLPTSQAVAAFVEGKGYITSYTDNKVQTSQANTTKIYVTGTPTAGTSTSTLNFDSNVYLTTTAGTLHATIFEGNLSGTASRATADSDGNTINSTYLKLSGGNVTGAVTFGSSISVDELTAGDLVVNGNASFTNNAQFNTINGVTVGSNPKFTDTNYYHTTGSWGGTNNLTYTAAANGEAGALAFTLATATTGVYGVTKLSSATNSTSTTLAATASAVKAAYDLAASKTDNTGTVTSVQVQASSPLQSSSSAASSNTLSTTISFTNQNVNTVLAGPSSGTTAAAPTFRKLVAADIPDISGTYYLASNPSGYTTNTGTVTSVRVQASSPLTSTTNTASSTTLDTTIKFSNQNKNLVLAGPSSGNAAAPTFRSLVADDIPSISKSKISDFPTSLKNPNAIRLSLFNETAARAAANQGTATSYVDYDGSTANQSFSAAGKNAITSIGISGDTLSWVRADGSSGSSTVTITASIASGATILTDTDGNAITTTGNTTPVWFEGGIPKDITGIAFSLLPTGTDASNVAVGNHSHGNITNGGDITTTATIASGDRLVINDESESKINNSSITFGTSTTTFLTNKGTWATPVGTTYTFDGTYNASSNKAATVSTVTNAINALDGGTIGTPSTSKTVTAISQTNGNISVTFGDISITKSQISDFPTSMTPAAHNHSQIVTVGDQRSTATTPNSYNNALIFQGLKSKATVGSPSDDTYSYLVGLRGWADSSGGNSHELAFNNTGIFWRQGATTSWGNWYRIYTTGNKPTASDVGLGNVTNYDASSAIKSITRSGTTFTYTTVAGGTGTFTQQDNNTWDALSTSQAGYVAKAPNDTSKFLRGDATWAAVTKANVGLSNVENTALSTWTGSSNITTVGTITSGTWNGSAIPVANGGTGATTAANARTNLGLGSAATASTTTSIASGGTGLPTAGTVYTYVANAISGASNTYVTIATNQTITASQKTFNGATRWSVTNSTTGSKYGACNYDVTLDALVFSFGTI